jgi:WD40 repeat protein
MSVNQKILIKSLGIGIVGLFAIFLLSSICHIAIFGPLWVEYTWFTGKKLGFSYKTELNDTTGVQTIVWSTDGRYLLLGSFDNSRFKVYDTRDWTLVDKFRTAEGGLVERSQAQFIPFSYTILLPTISSLPPPDTTSLQEWDVEKNAIKKSFSVKFIDPAFAEERGSSHPGGVAVSGDGKFVADSVGGDYGDIFVFDHKTSQIVQRIHCDRYSGIGALALNENGGTVVVGDCHRNKVSFFRCKDR